MTCLCANTCDIRDLNEAVVVNQTPDSEYGAHSKKAVAVYILSKLLLPFGFAER